MGVIMTHENRVAKLYTEPSITRNGVGSRLFQTAEKSFVTDGHHEVALWAVFDSAILFYKAMGMREAGRKFDLLGEREGRNVMLMKKDLTAD